jgi:hypothetical protein
LAAKPDGREAVVFVMLLCCVLLLAVTTLTHFEVLTGLTSALPRLHMPSRTKLVIVIFAVFLAHAIEILFYGIALYLLVHAFPVGGIAGGGGATLPNCLYFSAETFSSLGFGDVVPTGPVRMLAGAEALNGLLLIGWSVSYAYIAMERFWNDSPRR